MLVAAAPQLEGRYQNALQIRRASGKEASVLAELWNVVD